MGKCGVGTCLKNSPYPQKPTGVQCQPVETLTRRKPRDTDEARSKHLAQIIAVKYPNENPVERMQAIAVAKHQRALASWAEVAGLKLAYALIQQSKPEDPENTGAWYEQLVGLGRQIAGLEAVAREDEDQALVGYAHVAPYIYPKLRSSSNNHTLQIGVHQEADERFMTALLGLESQFPGLGDALRAEVQKMQAGPALAIERLDVVDSEEV